MTLADIKAPLGIGKWKRAGNPQHSNFFNGGVAVDKATCPCRVRVYRGGLKGSIREKRPMGTP